MNWFFIALIAPFLWAITNHLDKIIISKYFKISGVGALVLYTALFDLLFTPIIFVINNQVTHLPFIHIVVLIGSGMLGLLQAIMYIYALSNDEASVIVPLFQLIPVLTYILSYIFLGEFLTLRQILSALLIIFGAVIISLDLSNRIPKLKLGLLGLMIISSLIIAINSVIFKAIALQDSFWISMFWTNIGVGFMGLLLFLFIRSYRKAFIESFTNNKINFFALNTFNEIINIIGGVAMTYATLLAPIALVWVVNGFQPVFVFLIGAVLTLFWPHITKESLSKKDLIQRIISIIIIFVGTYLLNT